MTGCTGGGLIASAGTSTSVASAFDRAVKMLAGRSKSRARLEQGLLAKGHTAEEVEDALRRAAELGYIDDARHAAVKARAALAEGHSLASTLQRLEAEGIEAATARAALDAAVLETRYDELAAAKAIIKRRRLTGPQALRFLLGRGYPEDVARTVVPHVADD